MKRYKLISAAALYASFLLVGHHGPLSNKLHENPPLVISAPSSQSEQDYAAIAENESFAQVLGASTSAIILYYNPLNQTYESSPDGLSEKQSDQLNTCLSRQTAPSKAAFEKCYKEVLPRAISQDHNHTHKKHSFNMPKKDEDHDNFYAKSRKLHPRNT